MYLVSSLEAVSEYQDASAWVATAMIDELEALAVECREAAADHRGSTTQQSLRTVRSLNQVAETCEEIIQMMRREFLAGVASTSKSTSEPASVRFRPDWHA